MFQRCITATRSGRDHNVAVGKLVNKAQINYDEIKVRNEFLSTHNVSQILLALRLLTS